LLQTFNLRLLAGELSAIVAKEREIQRLGSALRFLNRDSTPNPFRLPEALTTLRRAFSFTVEVRGFLVDTGERVTQNVTVTSSTLLTRAAMEELAIEAVTSGAERYGMEVESAIPIRGTRAGALGTFS
jgi:hypothetical protein